LTGRIMVREKKRVIERYLIAYRKKAKKA
jgi:hypothetical protein